MTQPMQNSQEQYLALYPMPGNLPPVIINDPSLPIISIVTPSFNQGKFIRETIESVLTQDYPNIEYWVIDGGSSDETLTILKEYEHDLRFHWISEQDSGQSDAINKGLARCRGEIFNWLCSDDIMLPGTLRHVANAWVDHQEPAIIYGLAKFIDEHGGNLGYCPFQSPQLTLQRLLTLKTIPYQPATFVPTQHFREIGGLDPTYHFTMDLDMWVKVGERVPFVYVGHDMALYRLHSSSKGISKFKLYIPDVSRIMNEAIQKGLVTPTQGHVYENIFNAKVCFEPRVSDFAGGFTRLVSAVRSDYRVLPEALMIIARSMVHLLVGEAVWHKLRTLRPKPGGAAML